jgi:hypothetical protein
MKKNPIPDLLNPRCKLVVGGDQCLERSTLNRQSKRSIVHIPMKMKKSWMKTSWMKTSYYSSKN